MSDQKSTGSSSTTDTMKNLPRTEAQRIKAAERKTMDGSVVKENILNTNDLPADPSKFNRSTFSEHYAPINDPEAARHDVDYADFYNDEDKSKAKSDSNTKP